MRIQQIQSLRSWQREFPWHELIKIMKECKQRYAANCCLQIGHDCYFALPILDIMNSNKCMDNRDKEGMSWNLLRVAHVVLCLNWSCSFPPTDVEQLKIRDTDDTGGLPCGKPVPSFHRQHWDFCGIRSAMHCKTVQPQWILCSDLWAQLVKSPNGYGHDKKWPRRMGSSTINNEIRTRNHATIVFFFKKWGFALLLKTLRPVKVSSKIKPNQKHTQTQIHHETPSNWYSSMTQTWACSAHIDHWMQHCLTLLLRMERLSAQPSDLQGVLPAEWITIRFIIYIYII